MTNSYKHKFVRDLAWSITSPNLLNDNLCVDNLLYKKEYSLLKDHLLDLDKDPSPLIDFLNSKNTHRLGHYFEQLISYWLDRSDRFDLIDANIQIANPKNITQGEVDLILYDKLEESHQQWELAVKYFLAHSENGNQVYIGPNANDFLHKKLKKLKDKQCKILDSPDGLAYLKEKKISTITTKLFVKGWLYYHPKQLYCLDSEINSGHLKSWWVYESELEEFLSIDEEFLIIHKKEWLSTAEPKHDLMSKKECIDTIKSLLEKSPRSIYISIYNNKAIDSMGFVVHNDWPHIQNASYLKARGVKV